MTIRSVPESRATSWPESSRTVNEAPDSLDSKDQMVPSRWVPLVSRKVLWLVIVKKRPLAGLVNVSTADRFCQPR